MYDRPRFNRRNPYSFLRGYRENHEGGFDPNFVPVPYPGEFGGLGSFIVGGLAVRFNPSFNRYRSSKECLIIIRLMAICHRHRN